MNDTDLRKYAEEATAADFLDALAVEVERRQYSLENCAGLVSPDGNAGTAEAFPAVQSFRDWLYNTAYDFKLAEITPEIMESYAAFTRDWGFPDFFISRLAWIFKNYAGTTPLSNH